jgi:hypothetical protein
MAGVFRNIDPPPPHRPASVLPPTLVFGAGGVHTRWVEKGWGVNSSEDARHCSVLYICKYILCEPNEEWRPLGSAMTATEVHMSVKLMANHS